MMWNIGNLTKVYGDSILATIVKSKTANLGYKRHIDKYSLVEVFNSVVERLDKYNKGTELNPNKKMNLYDKLLDNEYREDYLNQFFCWAEKKMQFVGIDFNKGLYLYLDNIRKKPRKRLFREDANILYLYNKSKHLTLLQEIVTEEIKNKEDLILSERVY